MKTFLLTLGALLAAVVFSASAQSADNFPSKPINMVVPFAAGGPTDNVARSLAGSLKSNNNFLNGLSCSRKQALCSSNIT